MAKKKETYSVVHCGVIIPLKGGKGKCPKCSAEIDAEFKVKKPEKTDSRKRDAGRGRNAGDMWFELGALFVGVPPVVFFLGLLQNGLQSFNMAVFTLVVLLCGIGYAMIRLTGKKA